MCGNCGTVNDAPAITDDERILATEELDYHEYLRRQAGNEPELIQQIVECPQCGAQTALGPNAIAGRCAFCATPLLTESAQEKRVIRPRALVPFAVEQAQAHAVFTEWIAGRWFAPNALKATVRRLDGVRGVYLPCWTFDASTSSDYTGQRGIDRTVTEQRTDAQGNRVTVRRTETDWYFASGHVSMTFDDQLVPASASVPTKLAEVLRVWDTSALVPWSPDYVAGFTVETYQLALEPAFAVARSAFDDAIDGAVRQDIGGNHQRVSSISTQYHAITFKHILLPIWIASYMFGGKAWRVVVNGQTGEVRGDRPWSWWKIGFATLCALVVVTIVYLAMQQR